ncbi:flagellar hook protein 1 [Thermacetogenium phaeum DSM 12270]|uniref:Flagellar hook-associated protein 1 n=1 Tax=Thermacetogenium phaeum (strain ATCC BAA-254 / DSM 26808 / PB) TaxID=1089553 RepID=K4LFS2_THEPS|nr:flagellar hook-associated protein FlgK [Thermacetogenium phaeum]AFV10805.1 flagellar hook protein 1 [Thermacetogenium phaeum DSM 12270]
MSSIFFGLEIGRRGLQAQQRALDVTAHNVANANTPGYTRQEAVMAAADPIPVPSLNMPSGAGQLGTGVEITAIRRLRDGFIDLQIRNESISLGYWEARQENLNKIEGIFNEPSESGLQSVFELFWQSLEELSKNPESLAARSLVLERAQTLTETFNHLDSRLQELQQDINATVKIKVDEINSLGRQIADLNQQILKIEVMGARANDLRDRRDLLVDQLAKIVPVQVQEDGRGVFTVTLGGCPLVEGAQLNRLAVENDPGVYDVVWETPKGREAAVDGGYLGGLLDMRDDYIPDLREKLDNLAAEFAIKFNEIHRQGAGVNGDTGMNFFINKDDNTGDGITAGNIGINEDIVEDPLKLAAAVFVEITDDPKLYENKIEISNIWYTWDTGDGSNALDLAGLKHQTIDGLGTTFDDYYRSMIGVLGVDAQQAVRMKENQELLVSQLENSRQAVSGVSLDEEMINMIKFQHAYSAASRLITALDEMLEIIINRMGVVGR